MRPPPLSIRHYKYCFKHALHILQSIFLVSIFDRNWSGRGVFLDPTMFELFVFGHRMQIENEIVRQAPTAIYSVITYMQTTITSEILYYIIMIFCGSLYMSLILIRLNKSESFISVLQPLCSRAARNCGLSCTMYAFTLSKF